jgi:5-(carboxyamino)imidazole ribonucleotide mutase
MPGGIPVSTTAINGAKNAALIAASIFALTDKALEERLIAFRKAQTEKVLAAELPQC